MRSDVDVIIPWQEGCIYRKLNLDWVVACWEDLGYNVVIGVQDPADPWCKARAVKHGLEKSTASTIAVVDGDVWCLKWDEAIDRVVVGEVPYVMPHSTINRLEPEPTSAILMGGDDFSGPLIQPAYNAVLGGGAVILTRETYERCPLDLRFVGWGGEDEAWGIALRSYIGGGGVTRDSPLYHLWHPPQDKHNYRPGHDSPRILRDRYIAAARYPDTLAELIAELVSEE